ncbi:hypothetical protein B2J88_43685 [Rhodococcus sp. SRB_17]|nr:hypothetical protein [Rhodococcus sp. SRB_17]
MRASGRWPVPGQEKRPPAGPADMVALRPVARQGAQLHPHGGMVDACGGGAEPQIVREVDRRARAGVSSAPVGMPNTRGLSIWSPPTGRRAGRRLGQGEAAQGPGPGPGSRPARVPDRGTALLFV